MSPPMPLKPHMDEDGLLFFKKIIFSSKCYLEYGSGGSTIYAANTAKVPSIISIETDKNWITKIKTSISSNSNLYLVHCDLGEVGMWGFPKNREKIESFWEYSFRPWDIAENNLLSPDTILIDGRFRISSFLVTLLNARPGTLVLFDDYFNRSNYWVVEEFCKPHEQHGRMGVFIVPPKCSYKNITRLIAKNLLTVD